MSRAPDEPGRGDRVDTEPVGDPRAEHARSDKLGDDDIATAPIREIKKTTHHSATISGRPFAYLATAGTLTIRDDDGKPVASQFYVVHGGERRATDHFPL